MSVIVDTSVWSLALRRRTPPASSPAVTLLRDLITDDRVILLGAIRQEILSEVRSSGPYGASHRKVSLRVGFAISNTMRSHPFIQIVGFRKIQQRLPQSLKLSQR